MCQMLVKTGASDDNLARAPYGVAAETMLAVDVPVAD